MNLKKLFSTNFKNPNTAKIPFKISILIGIFLIALKAPLDPDMYWHLKTGELMWHYQTIPHIDWFSYTMNNYPYVNLEWLTEIGMFFVWKIFNFGGLAILFALITTITFGFLLPKSIKKAPFYLTYLFSFIGAFISSHTFGARPQILSQFGLALLLFIIAKYRNNEQDKTIWLLPIIFLLWANMHGGFILGIAFMVVFLILEKFLIAQKNRLPNGEWLKLYNPLSIGAWKKLTKLFTTSILLTFLNPYTWHIYEEISKSLTDNYNKNNIIEWLAPNFHTNVGFIFGLYVILIFIAIALFKKIDLFSFVFIPLMLFFAFQAVRNIPFFIIIATPFLVKNLSELENIFVDLLNKKIIAVITLISIIFILPINLKTINIIKSFNSPQEIAEQGGYPYKALDFLLNNKEYKKKNIFNSYAWGGYIIGNNKCQIINDKNLQCEPKTFIDGRMDYWKLANKHILKDYITIETISSGWEKLINKYQIQILFINKKTALARALRFNDKWDKGYEDDFAIIYEKK